MTELFRNDSPGALTFEQAVELEMKRAAQRRRARQLAELGRGSDTEVAHLTRGELVVPLAMQTPALLAILREAAAAYNVPLEMLSIGTAMNQINPATGLSEFGVMDWISGLFGPDDQSYGAQQDAHQNHLIQGGV